MKDLELERNLAVEKAEAMEHELDAAQVGRLCGQADLVWPPVAWLVCCIGPGLSLVMGMRRGFPRRMAVFVSPAIGPSVSPNH